MIRKLIIYTVLLTSLNGCVQGLALVGPLLSYSQGGSALQAGLSFGSNQAYKEFRTKKSTKDKKNTFDNSKIIIDDYSILSIKNK